jgi:hypothetical protein
MVALVRRYGFAASRAGELGVDANGIGFGGALGIIVFGMVAAWIVAFFGAIIDFLQLAPQTAVATGVLWQVTYAQLLARFGNRDDSSPPDQAPPNPVDAQPPPPEQPATDEVAEEPR